MPQTSEIRPEGKEAFAGQPPGGAGPQPKPLQQSAAVVSSPSCPHHHSTQHSICTFSAACLPLRQHMIAKPSTPYFTSHLTSTLFISVGNVLVSSRVASDRKPTIIVVF